MGHETDPARTPLTRGSRTAIDPRFPRGFAQLADIFDELEEDARAERARRLWARYGGALALVALLAAGGVAGWQGWNWWQSQAAERTAAVFLEAHRAAAAEGADLRAVGERFQNISADAPPGYRALARLRAAALKAETGDRAAALALWNAVAEDTEAEPIYRDLGALMWAWHGLDTEAPEALEARLAPLPAEGNPWRATARQLRALTAVRRGDRERARTDLRALAADVTAPRGLRDRAAKMAASLEG